MTRCVPASPSKKRRTSGSSHSSSRCVIQRALKTSSGPSPTVAYATRLPSTSQKRMSCSMARDANWPDRAMSKRWPAMARRRAMRGTHARAMQSRYVDGVVIRPLRNGDAETVVAVFKLLGPEAGRRRFGGAKTHLSRVELELLARVDAGHHVLVAYAAGDPQPAGLGLLIRDGSTAEVAFEVADEQHGRGIGTALARALAADARAAGISELHATVAWDNARALSLLARVSRRLRATWLGAERRVVAAVD